MKSPLLLVMMGLVICGLMALTCFGKPGVVRMLDGHRVEGDVTEGEETVTVIQRGGIRTVVQRTNIAGIDYTPTVQDEFQARLKKLAKDDVQGRIELARWAFDRHDYRLARVALDQALEIDPNNRAATDLVELIQAQKILEANSRRATTLSATAPATRAADAKVATERRLLTAEEINRIRQSELKSSDVRTRIRFDNNLAKRFAADMNIPYAQFIARPLAAQAVEMLGADNGRYREDVKILSDPSSMLEYRRGIQPNVLANCATVGCHGAPGNSRLVLFPQAAEPGEAPTYTNFYILQHYTRLREHPRATSSPFAPDPTMWRLIDRDRPGDSLLVQFSVPGEIAQVRHPQVAGYRPWIKGTADPHYRTLVLWMGQMLVPRPLPYDIKYDIPGDVVAPAATQPAATRTAVGP